MANTNELHVIFGAGPVGQAVMDELIRQGKRVRMVSCSGLKQPPAGVEVMQGDASSVDFARHASEGAKVVYFALNPAYTEWARLFPPMHTAVLEGAIAAKAKLVVMENLYGYGRTQGKPLTEDLPLNADFKKGKVRAAMTGELLAAHQAGKVVMTIARASDFFGPRVLESAMGERVFVPAVQGGTIQLVGRLDTLHTHTYMPDIGRALVILAENDRANGQVWHIPSDRAVTAQEFINLIVKTAGQKPKVQAAGKLLLSALGLFMPIMRELKETYYQFDEPFIMDSSKFERAFGLKAARLEDAIPATIDWYRSR